jgi:hypothetical protein
METGDWRLETGVSTGSALTEHPEQAICWLNSNQKRSTRHEPKHHTPDRQVGGIMYGGSICLIEGRGTGATMGGDRRAADLGSHTHTHAFLHPYPHPHPHPDPNPAGKKMRDRPTTKDEKECLGPGARVPSLNRASAATRSINGRASCMEYMRSWMGLCLSPLLAGPQQQPAS